MVISMRLPLVLACVLALTSCQRQSAGGAGCRQAVDDAYLALGWRDHKVTAFHATEESSQGALVMRTLQVTVDLTGKGEIQQNTWDCDYSDGKHFLVMPMK